MTFITWLINFFRKEEKVSAAIRLELNKSIKIAEDEKTPSFFNQKDTRFWKTSDKGIAFIKKFEGFKEKAYLCPAGKWTIGYGFTKDVKSGDTISKWGATKRLKQELFEFEAEINKYVGHLISEQYQFDALVSFIYNIGVTKFDGSSLLRYLKALQFNKAANQFRRWVYAGGKKLNGLVKRREAEKKLFLEGVY